MRTLAAIRKMRRKTNERIQYTISHIFYAETSALTFNPYRKPNHIIFGLSVLARGYLEPCLH
jgi:hypothetical protein